MSMLKEFFSPRILINCLLFSVVISFVLLWRITYVKGMEIVSEEAAEIYLWLVIITFFVLRIISFLLYLLARREERAENERRSNP